MNTFKIKAILILLILIVVSFAAMAQEINWYSIDQGGGQTTQGNILITGVIGQVDSAKLEGGRLTISGGYIPFPADLIFENQFEQ